MEKHNIIIEKSRDFAIRIIRLYKYLCEDKKEFVMSKQILRSGTSIGANIAEGYRSPSFADFYAKLGISLKEAAETEYWLYLLHETDYLDDKCYNSIYADCIELIKLLTAILKNRNKPKTQ